MKSFLFSCLILNSHLGKETVTRHAAGKCHIRVIKEIEERSGIQPGEPITKEILQQYCIFSARPTATRREPNTDDTLSFEAISVYNAVVQSHSYNSLERIMSINSFVLYSRMMALRKNIMCSQKKARLIVKNVLGPYCFQMVCLHNGSFHLAVLKTKKCCLVLCVFIECVDT